MSKHRFKEPERVATARNPFQNRNIGRRTGKDIKAGKVIRKTSGGFENFDDYWSESDADLTRDGTFVKPDNSVTKQLDNSSGTTRAVVHLAASHPEKASALHQAKSQTVGSLSHSHSQLDGAGYKVQVKNAINPFKNRQIGRRTGRDVKASKNIRVLEGGFENFDDYWSESDADSISSFSHSVPSNKSDVGQVASIRAGGFSCNNAPEKCPSSDKGSTSATQMAASTNEDSANQGTSEKEWFSSGVMVAQITTSCDEDSASWGTADMQVDSEQQRCSGGGCESENMQVEVAGEDENICEEAIQEDTMSKRSFASRQIAHQESCQQKLLEKGRSKRKVVEEDIISASSQAEDEDASSTEMLGNHGTDTESQDKCSCSEAEESMSPGVDCPASDADDVLVQQVKKQTAALQQMLPEGRSSEHDLQRDLDKQVATCKQTDLCPSEVLPQHIVRENYYKGDREASKISVEESLAADSAVHTKESVAVKPVNADAAKRSSQQNDKEAKKEVGVVTSGLTEGEEEHTLLPPSSQSKLHENAGEKSKLQNQKAASYPLQQSGTSQLTANASPLPTSQKSSVYLSIAGDVTGSITCTEQNAVLTPQRRLFGTRKRLSYAESPRKVEKAATVAQKQRQMWPASSPIAEAQEECKTADNALGNQKQEVSSQSPNSVISEIGMFVSLASQSVARSDKDSVMFSDEDDGFDILDVSKIYSRNVDKCTNKQKQKERKTQKVTAKQEKRNQTGKEAATNSSVPAKARGKKMVEAQTNTPTEGKDQDVDSLNKAERKKKTQHKKLLTGLGQRKKKGSSQESVKGKTAEDADGGGRELESTVHVKLVEGDTAAETASEDNNFEVASNKVAAKSKRATERTRKSASFVVHKKRTSAKGVLSGQKGRGRKQVADLEENCPEADDSLKSKDKGDETEEICLDDDEDADEKCQKHPEDYHGKTKIHVSEAHGENMNEDAEEAKAKRLLNVSKQYKTSGRRARKMEVADKRASQKDSFNSEAVVPAKRSIGEDIPASSAGRRQSGQVQTGAGPCRSSVGRKRLYNASQVNTLEGSVGCEGKDVANAGSLFHAEDVLWQPLVPNMQQSSKEQKGKTRVLSRKSEIISESSMKGDHSTTGKERMSEHHRTLQGGNAKCSKQTLNSKRKSSSHAEPSARVAGGKMQLHKKGRQSSVQVADGVSPDENQEEASMAELKPGRPDLSDEEAAALSSTPVTSQKLSCLDIPDSALKSGISFRRISYLPSTRARGKRSRRKLVNDGQEYQQDIISSPHLAKHARTDSTAEDSLQPKCVPAGDYNGQLLTSCLVPPNSTSRKNKDRRVTINNTVTEHHVLTTEHEGSTTVLPSMSASPVHYHQMHLSLSSPQKCCWEKDKIIPPEEHVEGLRRSQRTRVRPLEWYKNERIVYDRRLSGAVIVAVQPSNEKLYMQQENLKRRRRRQTNLVLKKSRSGKGKLSRRLSVHAKIPAELEVTRSTQIPVIHPDTQEEVLMGCFNPAEGAVVMGPQGNDPSPGDPFTLKLLTQQKLFTTGVLTLAPLSEKPLQRAISTAVVFSITYGKVIITINRATSILQTGDHFFVPKGTVYSVRNLREDEATLTFTNLLLDMAQETTKVTCEDSPS